MHRQKGAQKRLALINAPSKPFKISIHYSQFFLPYFCILVAFPILVQRPKVFRACPSSLSNIINSYYLQIMFLKKSQDSDSLRQSFVPMGDKLSSLYSQPRSKQPKQKASQKLLARYHDESFVQVQPGQTQQIRERYLRLYRGLSHKLPVINPQSTLLALWSVLMELAILYHFCQIPIAIFFTEAVYITQFQTKTGIAINAVSTVLLLVNTTVVRPLTGFYKGGALISSAHLTISRYARLQLILNLLAWLSLLIYVTAGVAQLIYLKILFYLMTYSLNQIDEVIMVKLELKRLTIAAYKLIKIIIILLFAVLWISCIYFAIDYHYYLLQDEYYPVNLWLTNSVCSQYSNGTFIDLGAVYPWYVWLNYAFYWTLQSITGVGYGDMTPRNPPEVVYCNFVVLFMSIAYAFFINSIWEIIAEVNETGDSKANHMKLVKKYQKKYELEPNLTNRLGSYIYEIWSHGKSEQTQNTINESLSEELRGQLLLIRQKQFFSKIPFFKDKFDTFQETFQQLSKQLKEQKFGQDQIIMKKGSFHDRMCSVLIGEVKICYPNSKLIIKLEKDSIFGVADFLINRPSSYSAYARTFCKITYLDYNIFAQEMKKRPIFYEILRQNIEEIQRNHKHQISGEDCWVCSNPTHPAHLCVQYFDWMFNMRNFQDIILKKELRKKKQRFPNLRHARKFFNRRKTDKATKIVHSKPITLAQVDTVTSYKYYRPQFSI